MILGEIAIILYITRLCLKLLYMLIIYVYSIVILLAKESETLQTYLIDIQD